MCGVANAVVGRCSWSMIQVYGGYVTGIMGDEDYSEEERVESVCELLTGATEEVRTTAVQHHAIQITVRFIVDAHPTPQQRPSQSH